MLVGAYACMTTATAGNDIGVIQLYGANTPNNRLTGNMHRWFTVYFWYWTSMLWSIDTCPNKASPDQYHETISQAHWSWLLIKCWLSIIGLWAHVRLTCCKHGQLLLKPVNANPGLKVNQVINFSCIQMFFTDSVFCILWLYKLKTEKQTIYRKPHHKARKFE